MKYLLHLALITLFSCSSSTSVENEKVKPQKKNSKSMKYCVCMEIYKPVCGRDKKDYANKCEAECQGIKYTSGMCTN